MAFCPNTRQSFPQFHSQLIMWLLISVKTTIREGLQHLSPSHLLFTGAVHIFYFPCCYSVGAACVLPRPTISLSLDPLLSCLLKDITRAIFPLFPVSSIFLSTGTFPISTKTFGYFFIVKKKSETHYLIILPATN